MHRSQHGIALVEAILAVVFLGIIGVTILGQFSDWSNDTAMAAQRSVDGKTSSAAAINYTARVLDPVVFVALGARSDCAESGYSAAFPSDYDDSGFIAAGTGTNCR